MKQTVIIGILLGILLLTGCDNNEKEHDFVGIFTTANGIKFELRPDSTSIITFKDSMIYESSWKISKDRNNETYANIEFAGYQNYYYLKNGKLYRSIREMNPLSLLQQRTLFHIFQFSFFTSIKFQFEYQ